MQQKEYTPLIINAPSAFVNYWLMPRLGSFYKSNPEIKLHTITRGYKTNFNRFGIDASIFPLANDSKLFEHCYKEALYDEPFIPLVHPELLQKYQTLDPDTQTLIRLDSFDSIENWDGWFAANVSESYCTFKDNAITTTSSYVAAQAALNKRGVALLPLSVAEQFLSDNQLVRAYPKTKDYLMTTYFLCEKHHAADAELVLFRKWLIDIGQKWSQSLA